MRQWLLQPMSSSPRNMGTGGQNSVKKVPLRVGGFSSPPRVCEGFQAVRPFCWGRGRRSRRAHSSSASAAEVMARDTHADADAAGAAAAALQLLVDDCVLDVTVQVHRQLHTLGPRAPVQQPQDHGALPMHSRNEGVDIFGQSHPAKATDIVTCKNCGRQVQAGMFAPHLEKCMGRGRAAARAASRRIQGL